MFMYLGATWLLLFATGGCFDLRPRSINFRYPSAGQIENYNVLFSCWKLRPQKARSKITSKVFPVLGFSLRQFVNLFLGFSLGQRPLCQFVTSDALDCYYSITPHESVACTKHTFLSPYEIVSFLNNNSKKTAPKRPQLKVYQCQALIDCIRLCPQWDYYAHLIFTYK